MRDYFEHKPRCKQECEICHKPATQALRRFAADVRLSSIWYCDRCAGTVQKLLDLLDDGRLAVR